MGSSRAKAKANASNSRAKPKADARTRGRTEHDEPEEQLQQQQEQGAVEPLDMADPLDIGRLEDPDPAEAPEHDCILLLRDGKELPVHSLLLRIASPVLRIALSGAGRQRDALGRRKLSLPEDSLESWQALWRCLSPDVQDPCSSIKSMDAPKQLVPVAELLSLAHKYGVERAQAVAQDLGLAAARQMAARGLLGRRRLGRPDWGPLCELLLYMDRLQHLHLTEPYRAVLGVLRGELDRGSMKASALSSAVRDLAAGKHSTRQQQQQQREREREEREREVVLVDEDGAGQRAAGQGGRQGQRQGQGQGQQEGAGAREVLLHPRLLTDMLLLAQPPGEVCEACGREHNSDDSDDERSANGDSDSDSERHVWTEDSDVDDQVDSDNEGIDISDGEGDGGGQDPAE